PPYAEMPGGQDDEKGRDTILSRSWPLTCSLTRLGTAAANKRHVVSTRGTTYVCGGPTSSGKSSTGTTSTWVECSNRSDFQPFKFSSAFVASGNGGDKAWHQGGMSSA